MLEALPPADLQPVLECFRGSLLQMSRQKTANHVVQRLMDKVRPFFGAFHAPFPAFPRISRPFCHKNPQGPKGLASTFHALFSRLVDTVRPLSRAFYAPFSSCTAMSRQKTANHVVQRLMDKVRPFFSLFCAFHAPFYHFSGHFTPHFLSAPRILCPLFSLPRAFYAPLSTTSCNT